MDEKKIKVRLRLVIIKNDKLLLTWNPEEKFHYYMGGKLDFGETIINGAQREVHEECGPDVNFTFKKILYIRDFIQPENNEHSVELFILGDVDKFEELEKKGDPEHDGRRWLVWEPMENLPKDLFPRELSPKLFEDFKNSFPNQGEYIGTIS